MVFNSFAFIFVFLPLAVIGFYAFAGRNRRWAAVWLLLASLFFYGSWDYRYIPILLGSILANFWAGRRIAAAGRPARRGWLTASISFNLLLLCFFKYVNFFIQSINGVTGAGIPAVHIILPIGISFFTFTQISFLVDAYHEKVKNVDFADYLLFASYFPYIVAGPILHHQEMLPQFADSGKYRARAENFATGIAIFTFGLAKKLLIADNLATAMTPLFGDGNPQFFQAWLGMLAYTLQLYFDFSGYSDMAVGVSRLFGFQIPVNFNSPYKATSVSDFWQRWHISLSRFLRNYLYIPLGGNRRGKLTRYRNLLLTMLLGGLWHGANWTFVVWGGLHGLYLCIQHGWRHMMGNREKSPSKIATLAKQLLTLVAVMVAWSFFRAPDVPAALAVLAGMAGGNGVSQVVELDSFGYAMLLFSAFIAFCMPNTNELFLARPQALTFAPSPIATRAWTPNRRWAMAIGTIFALCVLSIERTNDFIYAQF